MEYWIWLRQIKGLGPIIEKRLLDFFQSPKFIYQASKEELMLIEGIGDGLANNIISARSLAKAYDVLEEVNKKKIKLLTYDDSLYPSLAKEYVEAPTLLFYKGQIKEELEGVGIVGSRRCSSYGKRVAIEAAEFLAHHQIPIISGMAKGIDGYAHIACLKQGGYTIAFLGTGVDICYPAEHRELMESIIEQGAVISEYFPNAKARPEFFPRRNGLISSWSKKLLVVEATEKSGALITAKLAKLQNREVLAPPHEIYSTTGKGVNQLIIEGATIYIEPYQLLFENQIAKESLQLAPSCLPSIDLSPLEEQILSCLHNHAKAIEEIAKEIKMNQVDLLEPVSMMELKGIIKGVAGKYVGRMPAT